ncbi:hypothetical protein GA0074692_4939 [Micromonospora pallida]|uniref:Flavin reductase n=1 Tax=Micromonospora pallida TaxID=145854 RepID=A0A1C6T8X3_9ACTN|nr:hypothetical protein [Micromonospora pallida]SCL38221.1 hypothetical protein GA0074692_4939 [Micromonospora pallida]
MTADEGHYCFGLGRLVLEVIEIGRRERHSDGLWLQLRGVEIRQPDGVRLRQRRVLVRLAAVAVKRGRDHRAGRTPVSRRPGTPELHVPVRPSWVCAGCGKDWPCVDRRRRLLVDYAGNQVGLAMLLASYMLDALAERPDLSPTELRAQFLGWLPRRL